MGIDQQSSSARADQHNRAGHGVPQWRRVVIALLVLMMSAAGLPGAAATSDGFTAPALTAFTPPAQDDPPAEAIIPVLRNGFGVTTSMASDEEINAIVASPYGERITQAVALYLLGEAGIGSDAEEALQSALGELGEVLIGAEDVWIEVDDELISSLAQVKLPILSGIDTIVSIVDVPRRADAIAQDMAVVFSEFNFKNLFNQYTWARRTKDPIAARAEIIDTLAPVVNAVMQARSLTEDELFETYETQHLAQQMYTDEEDKGAIRTAVASLAQLRRYYESGVDDASLLFVINSTNSTLGVANPTLVSASNIEFYDSQGSYTWRPAISSLYAESVKVSLDPGWASADRVRFEINDIAADAALAAVTQPSYVPGLRITGASEVGDTVTATFDGPILSGASSSPSVAWSSGDQTGTGIEFSVGAECPAPVPITAVVTAGPETFTVNATGPVAVDYVSSIDTESSFVEPNDPVEFSVEAPPAGVEVRWDFGNGQTATGATVTQTFPNSGQFVVTASFVDTTLTDCSQHPVETRLMSVEESTTWKTLPTTITSDTVLSERDVAGYLVPRELNVAFGATLTLEAGVVIKFAEDAQFDVSGSLVALGSVDRPVVLTALADDSVGGDTNGDGSASG
ncbi:MAG: PKD domain-containing protein, partial [Actinomycetota bacterium]